MKNCDELKKIVSTDDEWKKYLHTKYVLALFGSTLAQARHNYRIFMEAECEDSIIKQLRTGHTDDARVLGDDDWLSVNTDQETSTGSADTLEDLIEKICVQHGVVEGELLAKNGPHRFSSIRAEIALQASESELATISAVARRFNRSQPSLSRSVQKVKKAIKL
jgi:hypothetical protein